MTGHRLSPQQLLLALSVLLPCCLLLGLSQGIYSLSVTDIVQTIFGGGSEIQRAVLIDLRMPRVLLAALVGGMLAVCGAVTQGLFRNPLADPSLIGVTAGAVMGASLVIALNISTITLSPLWQLSLISLGAFLGGMAAVIIVYRLAVSEQGISVATMLLAGVGITALAGSITSLIEFYANNQMLRNISLWRMGGIDGATLTDVILALATVFIMLCVLPKFSRSLNALLLGESDARYLGIDTEALKTRLVILVAGVMGICVALTGAIAFVGLIVPHIIRLLIGPNHYYLLPASALGGAILVVLADALARQLVVPAELPVGLVTAFLGAPLFISLLRRRYIYGLS